MYEPIYSAPFICAARKCAMLTKIVSPQYDKYARKKDKTIVRPVWVSSHFQADTKAHTIHIERCQLDGIAIGDIICISILFVYGFHSQARV